jgi:hypothetical protein
MAAHRHDAVQGAGLVSGPAADLAARVAAGDPLSPADRRVIAQTIAAADERQVVRQLRLDGRRERDRLIRELARVHFPALASVKARATRIASMAHRYASASWARDREKVACPSHLRGRPEQLLWQAMKAHPAFPSSVRRLEEILK